jgi:uncharacterized alkaline shock family protein YloU
MTEIKTDQSSSVRIADEVLAIIAGAAALETEGVLSLAGPGRKNRSRGISLAVKDKNVKLRLILTVKNGKKLQDVAREVQKRVKSAVENMTGLAVTGVNVLIVA